MSWPHRLHEHLLGALLTRRTFSLEWFLALEALFLGLWVLLPDVIFVPPNVLARAPELITGTVFLAHGTAYVLALLKIDVRLCRHAALASSGLWSLVATLYVLAPPDALLVVPLTLGLALASMWVYLRLHLLYA